MVKLAIKVSSFVGNGLRFRRIMSLRTFDPVATEAVKKLLDQNITQVTETFRLPLPNLQIFLACVISGIDLIFHSCYRSSVPTLISTCPSCFFR